MSNVTFALALTAVTATTLFVTVGINPKEDGYGTLPWYYAGGCLLLSGPLFWVSRRLGRPRPAGGAVPVSDPGHAVGTR
jgi:hypothetical protein